MNIFVLNSDPILAARDHCDKHVVKMVLEYAQMMSNAHRTLDAKKYDYATPSGKNRTAYLFPGEIANQISTEIDGKIKWTLEIDNQKCYQYAHQHNNHPCTVWVRTNKSNYLWTNEILRETLIEYTKRYGKVHQAERFYDFIKNPPKNIPIGELTEFAQAMPDEYKNEDAVKAYRDFYHGEKSKFAVWKNTQKPEWYTK